MIDYMNIWKQVEQTNPEDTKKAKKGAHHFTSISPMSQIKKATSIFGPYGCNWGIVPESERFSTDQIGETTLINYDAVLRYPDGKIPVHACEKLAYKTQGANGYLKIDEEARKKVVTNAITKGLSMLGFNADIFMGMFDDLDYVNEVTVKSNIEKAEDREKQTEKEIKELTEKVKRNIETIENAVSASEIKGVYNSIVRELTHLRNVHTLTKLCDQGVKRLTEVKEEKLQQLKGEK